MATPGPNPPHSFTVGRGSGGSLCAGAMDGGDDVTLTRDSGYVGLEGITCTDNESLVISQNVTSLKGKDRAVKALQARNNFAICALQEIWSGNFKERGYKFDIIKRPVGRGGGVGIITKHQLGFQRKEVAILPHIEYLVKENHSVSVINIYRPPSGKFDSFLSNVRALL